MDLSKVSWKTTLTGILMILGSLSAIVLAYLQEGHAPENFTGLIGTIIGGIGLLMARDSDKTSEDVGADRWSAEAKRLELQKLGEVKNTDEGKQ